MGKGNRKGQWINRQYYRKDHTASTGWQVAIVYHYPLFGPRPTDKNTTRMLQHIFFTFAGFALLMWGADRFVHGASALANALGVPPLLIGLTIVGFATSVPEILVSISAARDGMTDMAVGNALGSNIANIGLVLGITALIAPIRGELSEALRLEMPLLVLLTPATLVLFLDGSLDRPDALILLAGLGVFLFWMTRTGMKLSVRDPEANELLDEADADMGVGRATLWLFVGFITLVAGAQLLVNGAEYLARLFGLSELVIGATVVAVGTSLPELAVSAVGALKGNSSIAVGNVIGSNVFNLLAVVGVAGLVHPAKLDPSALTLHYPVMIVLTIALLRIAYNPLGKTGLGRIMGFCLLASFFVYQGVLLTGMA
jgi:cation:H+ antiporter